jgi:hypothetical protein
MYKTDLRGAYLNALPYLPGQNFVLSLAKLLNNSTLQVSLAFTSGLY